MSDEVKAALITGSAIYVFLVLAPALSLQLLDGNVGKHLIKRQKELGKLCRLGLHIC
jgi:hypothetical protein